MQNKIEYIQTECHSNNQDLNRHIESLRARLGFAKFKLNNGWESNTLCDVECLWKQKQKELIKDIPIPRFTQQHIIDKRTYIQSSHHQKYKRSRLLSRSLSSPIGSSKEDNDEEEEEEEPIKKLRRKSHPPSFNREVFSSSSHNHSIEEPIKNSLDFLSYAIAMSEKDRQISTERKQQIEEEQVDNKADWTRTSQLRLSLSIPNLLVEDKSPEISPSAAAAAAAAHAMMMFVNSSRSNT
ncbi:hypothetical protein G6F57_004660 [Rhizopus arrhizus]|uniref:Uncharacterized protein n=1 Tax=Rhizopus oryzae TaxID=64495 RepID=A0A9P7BSW0_RHIOR|nr:hypothetical protein G6F23_012265 [Rhizopus arrhizus]KAG0764111.1 hypothetical protein G6F24_005482 [Rhizopus arrhizus]KAG0784772.1 hypothetical protein G6F22_008189 [Rhizopus arrhizus]KAG0796396.1 hypothetical protein G6F21_001342 [Rhizopus arrhizus]KAG0815955.1 hypothetical protein G6F20_003584 [Rhizopus arrhizus]